MIRGKGNLSTSLPYSQTEKTYFGFEHLGGLITLCEHNLNLGMIKQDAIQEMKLQNCTGKINFKSKRKREKRNSQKNGKDFSQKDLPCRNGR